MNGTLRRLVTYPRWTLAAIVAVPREQIAALRDAVEGMRRASASPALYPDADVHFHLALAAVMLPAAKTVSKTTSRFRSIRDRCMI